MAFNDVKMKRTAKQAKRRDAGGFVVCELQEDGFAFASAAEPFENRSVALKWLRRQTGGEIADFDRSRIGVGSLEKRDGRMFLTLDSMKSVGNWNKGLLKDAVKAAYKVADVKAPQMKTKVGNFKEKAEPADQAKPAGKAKPKRAGGLDDFFDSISEADPVSSGKRRRPEKTAKRPAPDKARPGTAKKKSADSAPKEEMVTEITVKASLGIISRELAELILTGAPAGSWLIRFDEPSGLYNLASKYGGRVMHRPTTSARGAKTIEVTRKKAGLLIPGRGPLPLHESMSEEEAESRLDRFGKWLVRRDGGKRMISLNIGGVVRHSAIGSIGAVKLVRTLKLDVAKVVLP